MFHVLTFSVGTGGLKKKHKWLNEQKKWKVFTLFCVVVVSQNNETTICWIFFILKIVQIHIIVKPS